MAKLLLIHWNKAEAEALAEPLSPAHEVSLVTAAGESSRALAAQPDAVLISLDRVPSHGLAIASLLRSRKASRHVPLVFVGGVEDKVARVRKMLPDAIFTTWGELPALLPRALKTRVESPAVPDISIGRPDTPLYIKLGISLNSRIITLQAPPTFERTLGALPEGVVIEEDGPGPADVVLLFSESESELARDFSSAVRRLRPKGKLWLAWPKKSGRVKSDLDMNVVRAFAMSRGWVDYKVCSLGATWSASVFGRRRAE